MHKNVFYFSERTIITDSLAGFREILRNSGTKRQGIFFSFQEIEKSLRAVKYIILEERENICFENLFFFNANDFMNEILENPIYLPKNINLFINESCFIGCTYCKNKNHIHEKLKKESIREFLSKYHVSDTMNFNIIGQGDPLFHEELFEILEYIKSFSGHVTFFSGGKSILYAKDITKLESLVDEFKINLSSSSREVYNQMHSLPITDSDFEELKKRLIFLGNKVTLITVLMYENVHDIVDFYKLALDINAFALEIKQNVFYPENDVLNNPILYKKVLGTIEKLIGIGKMNIVSNFISNSLFSPKSFHAIADSLIERLVELPDEIPEIEECHQFGNSLDITERGAVSVCCHYDIGTISSIDYTLGYTKNPLFQKRYKEYKKKTPSSCKNCPMPIDRYKNFLKHSLIQKL